MIDKPFSVNEALRYARHDFLNQLQLIKMNIDLARLDDAKAAIDHYTAEVKEIYALSNLKMPLTCEWLQTANWRFPGFQVQVTSQIDTDSQPTLDSQVHDVLERATVLLHSKLDPFTEQELHIHIACISSGLKVTFEANGEWEPLAHEFSHAPEVTLNHECKTTKNWRFHIEESKEG